MLPLDSSYDYQRASGDVTIESTMVDLSIVIPAYSEEKRIGKTLDALAAFIVNDSLLKKMNVEVLVVSADSDDLTHDIVEAQAAKFPSLKLLKPGKRVGKGRDVKFGVLQARGKAVMFMDADLATPLYYIPKFYSEIQSGADVVIGVRDLSNYRSSKLRNFYSYGGNKMYRFISRLEYKDTQCGFKMFTRQAARICFSRLSILGWDFDMEVLAIAQIHNLKVAPFSLPDWIDMPHSTHKDGYMKVMLRMPLSYMRIVKNRVVGRYTRRMTFEDKRSVS